MFKRALGLGVALIVGAMLVSASGAATTKAQKSSKIDVSTRTAVIHYLRSIHVNAKHAVIQRGLRNYAGAHCPGRGWACASTKHTVVQIAKRGGQNRFVCRSSKCVVVQFSGTAHGVYMAGRAAASPSKSGGNSGYCVKTGSGSVVGGGQTCSIIQTGNGGNMAGIYENSNKVSGLVQSQQYTATITQTASGAGNNTACVTQTVSQDGSTSNTNTKGVTVSLGAIQSIVITQNSLSGNNTATNGADPTTGQCNGQTLTQSQAQSSTVSTNGNIAQTLNPAVNSTITNGGNASLDVEQNQSTGVNGVKGLATGTNSAIFSQTTNQTLIANAKNGATVSQTENLPDGDGTTTPFSGIVGTINQDSKGQSTATVSQSETQCEDAANTSNSPALTACSTATNEATPTGLTSLTQTENGPVGLLTPRAKRTGRVPFAHKGTGTSSQTGAGPGVFDQFGLTQKSFQYSDTPGTGVTVNQVNTMQGDCASSGDGSTTGGSCAASQQATLNSANNSGTTSDGYTAGSIGQLLIKCDNGHDSCKPTPPPAPKINSHPTDPSESTSATFGWTEAATAGVTLKCSIDGGTTFTTCDSPTSTSYTGLSLGSHTFEVKAVDNFGNESAADSFTWTIVPYLTFDATGDGTSADGASAGWTGGVPGSSISLTVSNYPADFFTTFAQFTLHNFEGLAISSLPEPTFTTDNFNAGSPRYTINLSNGDHLWGYPPNTQMGTSAMLWDGSVGYGKTWSQVQAIESGQTVTGVKVIADGESAGTTDVISAFSFDGYSLSDFTNHWH